ncbi:MAG: hypothetical protein ACRC20_09575 [Segniliparus sp.]|uniref:hypothetical protein n=1 Tax=Segniliparus sp. TaxID=2804064 RepID=UPI003F332E35
MELLDLGARQISSVADEIVDRQAPVHDLADAGHRVLSDTARGFLKAHGEHELGELAGGVGIVGHDCDGRLIRPAEFAVLAFEAFVVLVVFGAAHVPSRIELGTQHGIGIAFCEARRSRATPDRHRGAVDADGSLPSGTCCGVEDAVGHVEDLVGDPAGTALLRGEPVGDLRASSADLLHPRKGEPFARVERGGVDHFQQASHRSAQVRVDVAVVRVCGIRRQGEDLTAFRVQALVRGGRELFDQQWLVCDGMEHEQYEDVPVVEYRRASAASPVTGVILMSPRIELLRNTRLIGQLGREPHRVRAVIALERSRILAGSRWEQGGAAAFELLVLSGRVGHERSPVREAADARRRARPEAGAPCIAAET